jgi:hypothetical protein
VVEHRERDQELGERVVLARPPPVRLANHES